MKLGEHAEIRARIGWRGLSAAEYTEDGPYLVAAKHIRDGEIDWATCDHLSDFRFDESPEIQLRAGDVVVSKDGTIGRVALVRGLPGRATVNGTMMLVRPHGGSLVPAFLAQVLNGAAFQRFVRERVSGSSIPHLFQRDLIHLRVPLPPISTQRRVAEGLAAVDDAIAAGEAVVEQLGGLKRSLTVELLAGRGSRRADNITMSEPSSGWSVVRLGDVAEIGNGSTPSRQRDDYWAGGTVPWLPTGKVNDRVIRSADEFVTEKALDECPIRLLPRGTVLVAMIGQGKTRGMAAYLDMEACINQNFAYIRPSARIRPWYLYHVLDHQYDLIRALSQGSNQSALNCGILKKYAVPLPPLQEQDAIADVITAIMQRAEAERAVIAERRRLKAALADTLLSGRVQVPDAA